MPVVSHARRMIHPLARGVRRRLLPRLMPPSSGGALANGSDGVRVIGLMSSASGLGNSARLCVERLAASGFSVSAADVAPLFGASDGIVYPLSNGTSADDAIALYHLNPPKLLPGIMRAGIRQYYRTYNIGYWAWELERLPDEWVNAIRYVDAVFVPSEFCRAAIRRYTDKPVCVVPHPLNPDLAVPPRRRNGGERFAVLAMLNFGSSFERKNPYAALRAFKLAFGSDPTARLIFKTSGGQRYPQEFESLRAVAGDMSNVEIIDEVWPPEKLMQLYRNVDVHLSLHRSEGYGLTIAEAMMMECPAVVTAWSGNMDFCGEDTAFLVSHQLIDFRDGDPSYEGVGEARWADPDVEQAARCLRLLRKEPELGRRKAVAARRALIDHTTSHSYEAALRSLFEAGEARTEARA